MQTHTSTCAHASTHTYTCSYDTSLLSTGHSCPHMGPPLSPGLHQGTARALRPYLVPSKVPAHSRPVDVSSVKEMHVTFFSLKLSLHLWAGKQACVLFCDPGRATCPWQACCSEQSPSGIVSLMGLDSPILNRNRHGVTASVWCCGPCGL